jgi:biopolymer transport protein ExbD
MNTKKRLFQRKKKKETGEMSLQITSMADIFTILLVFLLKGLASDAIQISPANATTLPAGAHSKSISETSLQVEITKDDILVEKEKIISLADLKKDIQSDETISSLTQKLSKERERQKLISASNDTVKISNQVIVLADQSVPFSTIKPILKTLAAQGYSEVKFAAIKD